MSLTLDTERSLVWTGGGSHRHLHVRYVAPVVTDARPRPPVRIAFCLDRSGSMGGGKLDTAKAALLACLDRLLPSDRFSVTTFDHTVLVDVSLMPATRANVARAGALLAEVHPGGSTNLFRGFLTACASIAEGLDRDTFARCLLLTDGQANCDVTSADDLSRHARELRQRGITLSTFGVGTDVDEDLLRAMADAGTGNYFYVQSAADIERHVRNELGDVLEVSQRDVVLQVDLPPGVEARWVGPQLGPFTRNRLSIHLGNLASAEQNDTVVQLRFPPGREGEVLACTASVADRDHPEVATARLAYTFAAGEQNDAQARRVEVDRLAAERHADIARLAAVRLNRQGRLDLAPAAIRAARLHLSRYMGEDPALLALHAALLAEEARFSVDMSEHSRKQQQFESSSRGRSKTALGTSSRAFLPRSGDGS
ncbi:MAG: VWA domain-containing protein [Deltaproteobacteria bacterium]|nr:VWA domain-containing protein [Deltaproteobacteria bacterium]